MIPVYSTEQIRQQDHCLIDQMGYPSVQLMELAGYAVAEWIHRNHPNASVQICCGGGNNGGDGYVIARWLSLWGHSVQCVAVLKPKTVDCTLNADRLKSTGVTVDALNAELFPSADILIDAILGSGQRLPLSTSLNEAVIWMGTHTGLLFAIDVPTGLNPNGAEICSALHTIRFDVTFALGGRKPCHYASSRCGQIVEIDIGLGLGLNHLPNAYQPMAQVIEEADIPKPLTFHSDMVKWNKGHLAIVAKRGAAVLAARAALKTGVGLVSVVMPKSEWPHLHGLPPEVQMIEPSSLNPNRHDALVIGPAWGLNDTTWLLDLWVHYPNPVIADADALHVLAQDLTRVNLPRVITPHSAEAAALLGLTREQVEQNRFDTINKLATISTVAILKGPYTLVSSEVPLITPVADSRLGVAGSGDVLSGLIGGLLAMGHTPIDSALIAVWKHSQAIPPTSKPSASGLIQSLKLT